MYIRSCMIFLRILGMWLATRRPARARTSWILRILPVAQVRMLRLRGTTRCILINYVVSG